MALARVITFALDGIGARRVAVEVDIRPGLPAFGIVGLGDKAVREARERVHAAIVNSGWEFPMRRITANLAPADLRKSGPAFDLPLAVGILVASGQLPAERLEGVAVFGELSLGGAIRPARGTLVVAEAAAAAGLGGLMLAPERAGEAALVDDLAVVAVRDLRAAAAFVESGEAPDPVAAPGAGPPESPGREAEPDLAEVRGQAEAVRALRIAAAGGHNLLFQGPPGTGKTMLARRLPSVLPPLTRSEALEVTRIRSLAGLHDGRGLVRARPFRAPHHGISASGLVGGGAVPAPGEVTLAHRGVLFLDELAEFPRPSLEALRQPLEDGTVTIVRAQRALRLPSQVTLVAATNPCPCGGAARDGCRCTDAEIDRYRRRLSGPLLDRMDLLVSVERPAVAAFTGTAGTSSAEVRAEVVAARERQAARLTGTGAHCNAHMSERVTRATAGLDPSAQDALDLAYATSGISARARGRIVRVARTLADLAARDEVTAADVNEALYFRNRLTAGTAVAA